MARTIKSFFRVTKPSKRFFYLMLWILTFEIVTILMGGGSLWRKTPQVCNPRVLSTCEP